jgi:GTP-dependent phosphoenolpyruvate carboxykinase
MMVRVALNAMSLCVTEIGSVWWEGMTESPPQRLISWLRTEWSPGCGHPAAHPNSRFTVSAAQCPVIDPKVMSSHWCFFNEFQPLLML